MHVAGSACSLFKASCNVLLGGCIPDVLAGLFPLPFPQAVFTFSEHKFKPRWQKSILAWEAWWLLPAVRSAWMEDAGLQNHHAGG